MPGDIIQLHILQLAGVLARFQRGKRFPRNLNNREKKKTKHVQTLKRPPLWERPKYNEYRNQDI